MLFTISELNRTIEPESLGKALPTPSVAYPTDCDVRLVSTSQHRECFRVGGKTFRDNVLYPAENFAPGVLPKGLDRETLLSPSRGLNRYENYAVDTAIPMHRVNYNGIVEMPFGKGKRFLRNSNKFVDAMVGGFQVAYTGTVVSQSFQVGAGNWGATSPVEIYKSARPVTDCGSGVCRPAYQWFNGYIPPTVVNAARNG